MAPKDPKQCVVVNEADERDELELEKNNNLLDEKRNVPLQIVWRNVVWMVYLHIASLYGIYLMLFVKWQTYIWFVAVYCMSALGITAGAHRLWAHRSYKARLPLRILLTIWNTMAFQNDVIEWARDHRVHHKFSETDADPHNATRGFFFAHMGWLLVKKHPDIKEKGKKVNVNDLLADPILRLQRKYYIPGLLFICFLLPPFISWYFWSESFWYGLFTVGILRYVSLLHGTWAVNSVAHMFGNRPYDNEINPTETLPVVLCAIGEGYHNYHHTFPQDYAASEFGWKVNPTTAFIDFCSKLGLAYGMKKISTEMVKKRMERTGDGTIGFGEMKKH